MSDAGIFRRVTEVPAALLRVPAQAVRAAGNLLHDHLDLAEDAGNRLFELGFVARPVIAGAALGSAVCQLLRPYLLCANELANAKSLAPEELAALHAIVKPLVLAIGGAAGLAELAISIRAAGGLRALARHAGQVVNDRQTDSLDVNSYGR